MDDANEAVTLDFYLKLNWISAKHVCFHTVCPVVQSSLNDYGEFMRVCRLV